MCALHIPVGTRRSPLDSMRVRVFSIPGKTFNLAPAKYRGKDVDIGPPIHIDSR